MRSGCAKTRARGGLLLTLALAGCSQGEITLPNCTEGRSHCVAAVSVGTRFGCAALVDGTAWCWGRNDESQLGYPTTDLCPDELPGGQTRSVACHTFPFQVPGLDRVVGVSSGGAFSCALRDDGTVRCWGSNAAGQLGNGLMLPSATPVVVRGLSHVTALSLGTRHACAVSDGRVYCWGANDRGQLGHANASQRCTVSGSEIPCEPGPVLIDAIDGGVTALAAGDAHTCARTTDGLALCWGDARYGQTGVGAASDAPAPIPQAVLSGALPLESVQDLVAGPDHTCARTTDGAVWCWGRDDHGELGSAASAMVPAHCVGPCAVGPTQVPGLATHPDAGADASADATVEAGTDAGLEAGTDGGTDGGADGGMDAGDATGSEAGTDAGSEAGSEAGATSDAVAAPSMVPRGIAAGGTFSCAALEDGTTRCWGDDGDAQLGDGRRTSAPSGPVLVIATPGAAATNPLQGIASVVAGSASACALLTDRSLRCWGSNGSGALGNGTTGPQSGPVPVTW